MSNSKKSNTVQPTRPISGGDVRSTGQVSANEGSGVDSMDKIVSLAKRRGFVFQSSEIYGGLNGAWDYGPLGVELLRNIKEEWWRTMTYREDIEGIDASILMHPRVWEASGHVEQFTDPMVDCRECRFRYRVDALTESLSYKTIKKILKEYAEYKDRKTREDILPEYQYPPDRLQVPEKFEKEYIKAQQSEENALRMINDEYHFKEILKLGLLPCPNCGNKGTFTDVRKFNLMFKTFIGPMEDSSAMVYLRPETAQGIYVNFLNVLSASRQKLPFGIAQIGKAFRNEINTKNFLFRTREFEQMEMQYFVKPGTDGYWFEYWREQRMQWFVDLGLRKEKLRFQRHEGKHLAHYARDAYDIEYEFPFGWGEIEGIHNRTDYDLSRHEEFSHKELRYFDDETKKKYIPYIIETSTGASRTFMAFLVDAYAEEEAPTANGKMETRAVLKFHPRLAPIKAAVFPLVNRDGMPEIAKGIENELRPHLRVFYDESGAVGRRYRRQDEVGTPFCITVDSQTLEDQTVTVRDRDSMRQERVVIGQLHVYLLKRISVPS